eukprot:TRINITY_DN5162_c0_g1_i3.p2 TRINITY_DN5162_c0_g1~~TRINITY_DN5162_c0_g1_i3.p2  ORF type:complete len:137 (+),score=45.58 TRINITY_DN5162_c0_g1_i3:63-473(+)
MVQLRSGAAAERAADYAFSAASDLRVRSLAGDLRLRLPRQEAEGLTVAALRRQLALATAEDVESLRLVAAGRMLEEAAALETFWMLGGRQRRKRAQRNRSCAEEEANQATKRKRTDFEGEDKLDADNQRFEELMAP